MKKIIEYIEKNEWNKIPINLDNISKPILNNNFLIHYCLIYKKFEIIIKILKIDINNILNIKNTVFIDLANLNDFTSILQLLKIAPSKSKQYILNPINNDWIIFYFLHNGTINNINELLSYQKYINWNFLFENESDEYPLKIFLSRYYTTNFDNNLQKIFMFLLNKNLDIIKKIKSSIIIDSCVVGFNKFVLNNIYNVFPKCINKINKKFNTALIAAILNKNTELIDYLLSKNIDVNLFSSKNALMVAIIIKDFETIYKLLKYKNLNVNFFDSNKWQPSHTIFMKENIDFPQDIKSEILKRTDDLNAQNLNGNSTLHLIFLNDNWRNYTKILEKKKIDLFCKNKIGLTPLNYLLKNATDRRYELDDILLLTAKSYINNINNNNIDKSTKSINIAKKCLENVTYKCLENVGTNIYKLKKSIIDNPKINFINEKVADYSLFLARDLDSYIYILYYLEKYDIGCAIAEKNEILSSYSDPNITKILKYYNSISENYPLLSNLSIFWHNSKNYIIPKNIFKIAMENKHNIIFIYITIINTNIDHANCLIIDKNKKKIIHFEPYGIIPNTKDLDAKLKLLSKKYFKNYTYYAPLDFMSDNSFQTLSNELDPFQEKHGDIGGFCLTWSLWFLELYIRNQNIDLKTLINTSIKKIINSKLSFLDYIRSFGNKLRKFHIKFLKKINCSSIAYNLHLTNDNKNYIYEKINNKLLKYI